LVVILGFPGLVGVQRKAKDYHQDTKAPRKGKDKIKAKNTGE
jgi:hypothetical protein